MADTAESIVKAMVREGMQVKGIATDFDDRMNLYLTARISGSEEQWSRFRGVPLDEVEKAMSDLARDIMSGHKGTLVGVHIAKHMDRLRRLRGGDS